MNKSSDPRKFKPGDIIRVVRGESMNWIENTPVVVKGYWEGRCDIIDLSPLQNGDRITKSGFSPYCFQGDCEIDTFLDAADKAVKNAKS